MKQHQIALVIQTEKGIRLTKVFIPFKKGDKDQHIIFEKINKSKILNNLC